MTISIDVKYRAEIVSVSEPEDIQHKIVADRKYNTATLVLEWVIKTIIWWRYWNNYGFESESKE